MEGGRILYPSFFWHQQSSDECHPPHRACSLQHQWLFPGFLQGAVRNAGKPSFCHAICNLLSEALHGSSGRGREPFQIATGEGRCQSCAGWGTCPCCSCASLSASRGCWEGQRALRKCRPAFTPTHQSLVTGKSKCKWNHGTIPRIHCRAS